MFVFGQEILFLSGKSQEILKCDVCGNHDTSWGSEFLMNKHYSEKNINNIKCTFVSLFQIQQAILHQILLS